MRVVAGSAGHRTFPSAVKPFTVISGGETSMTTVSDVGDAAGRPLLSVVIPARNEASRLPAAVECVYDFLSEHGSAELVLAADEHSQDETVSVADTLARRAHGVQVSREFHRLERQRQLVAAPRRRSRKVASGA